MRACEPERAADRTHVFIDLEREVEPFWFEPHDLSRYLAAVKLR